MNRYQMVTLLALSLAVPVQRGDAQATQSTLAGSWQGTLTAGPIQLRMVFDISRADDGVYLATLTVADQPRRIRVDRVDVNGASVRLELRERATFSGVAAPNVSEIRGTWIEGGG